MDNRKSWVGNMKTARKKQIFIGLLLILAVTPPFALFPKAKGLALTYNDSVWAALSVTGPDVTRPGNTEIYTISGRTAINMTGSVRIIIWLNSTAQTPVTLLDYYVVTPGTDRKSVV